jgi:hypothetical protein
VLQRETIQDSGDMMTGSQNLFSITRALLVMLGLLFLALALASPSNLEARSSDGTLVGTATDESGASIPNATVKAITPQYGALHQTVTDGVGTYRMDALQPVTYNVTFSAPGFTDLEVGSVILSGSVTTTVNGTLKVATTRKTIVIPAFINGLSPGTAGRNSVYRPGQWYFDTSTGRRVPVPRGKLENQAIEFRTEFFDAFNHPNLFTPSYNL